MAELWRQAEARRTHVYVHVPFCKSICSFCNYERLRPSRPELLQDYTARIEQALAALGPAMARHTAHSLFIGGGTPSVLTAKQLARVLAALEGLDWHPSAGRTMEGDPANLTPQKVRVAVEGGVEHLSFGIQTLDADINRAHERGPQGRERVGACFQAITSAGARASCDFVLGLAGSSLEQILSEIDEVLGAWRPSWVDVYQLTPTPAYVERHFTDLEAFWAHLKPFQERAPAALEAIARSHGYFIKRGRHHWWQLQRHEPDGFVPRIAYTPSSMEDGNPVNLLGLGPSARGKIWATAHTRGSETGFRGRRVSLRDEAREHLVLTLRDGDAWKPAVFAQLFGGGVAEHFPKAIAAWTDQGLLVGNRLRPQSRQERLEALLWLCDEADIEWELARGLGLDLSQRALEALGFTARRQHVRVDGTWLRVRPPLAPGGKIRLLVKERRASFEAAAKRLSPLNRRREETPGPD